MRAQISVVVLLVVGAVAWASGCSSGSGKVGSTTTTVDPARYTDKTSARTVTIDARDDLFTPQLTKVRAGTTVVFENGGRNPHNVVFADAAFHDIATDEFPPGTKVRVVFDKVGNHDFYCSLHGRATAGMRGSVLVVP
jgi:plastocyanin